MTDYLTDFDDRDVDWLLDESREQSPRGLVEEPANAPPAAPRNIGFHLQCGYRWDRHDNRNVLNTLPFGCPTSELRMRRLDGDR